MTTGDLPSSSDKPSLSDWLESLLPFRLPRVPVPFKQTAKNIDVAFARVVASGGENIAVRIDRSTRSVEAKAVAERLALEAAGEIAVRRIAKDGPFAERAIAYAYAESFMHQANRERIAELAAEEFSREPPNQDAPKLIDADWLTNFARLAENVSSEDLQQIWAKLLAGEIKNPGTFKISTLHRISLLSREDAEVMHDFLRYTINSNFVFKYPSKPRIPSEADAILVDQLGLITGTEGSLASIPTFRAGESKWFVSHDLAVRVHPEKDETLTIPAYVLTPLGKDLLVLSKNFASVREYVQAFATYLKSRGLAQVYIATLGPFKDGIRETISEQEIF